MAKSLFLIKGNICAERVRLGRALQKPPMTQDDLARKIQFMGMDMTPLIISSVGWLLGVAIRIVAALFGDYMYKRSAESAINSVREKADEDYDMKQYAYELQKKGGVDLAMGLLGLFIVRFGTYFLYMI